MTVERWGTVSDVITGVAAVIFAIAGGLWAWFRFRRQAPDLPRVNSSIELQCVTLNGVDYVSWVARIEHLAGAPLTILRGDGQRPRVTVKALPRSRDTVTAPAIAERDVFENDSVVAAAEYLVDAGAASHDRASDAVGYEGRFIFRGEWNRRIFRTQGPWTFECASVLLKAPA